MGGAAGGEPEGEQADGAYNNNEGVRRPDQQVEEQLIGGPPAGGNPRANAF